MSAACATPQMMVFPVPIQTLFLSHIHSLPPPVWYKPASHHRTALPAMAIVTGCSMANSQKALVWSILAINQHLHPHRRVNESTYRYYVVAGAVGQWGSAQGDRKGRPYYTPGAPNTFDPGLW